MISARVGRTASAGAARRGRSTRGSLAVVVSSGSRDGDFHFHSVIERSRSRQDSGFPEASAHAPCGSVRRKRIGRFGLARAPASNPLCFARGAAGCSGGEVSPFLAARFGERVARFADRMQRTGLVGHGLRRRSERARGGGDTLRRCRCHLGGARGQRLAQRAPARRGVLDAIARLPVGVLVAPIEPTVALFVDRDALLFVEPIAMLEAHVPLVDRSRGGRAVRQQQKRPDAMAPGQGCLA